MKLNKNKNLTLTPRSVRNSIYEVKTSKVLKILTVQNFDQDRI